MDSSKKDPPLRQLLRSKVERVAELEIQLQKVMAENKLLGDILTDVRRSNERHEREARLWEAKAKSLEEKQQKISIEFSSLQSRFERLEREREELGMAVLDMREEERGVLKWRERIQRVQEEKDKEIHRLQMFVDRLRLLNGQQKNVICVAENEERTIRMQLEEEKRRRIQMELRSEDLLKRLAEDQSSFSSLFDQSLHSWKKVKELEAENSKLYSRIRRLEQDSDAGMLRERMASIERAKNGKDKSETEDSIDMGLSHRVLTSFRNELKHEQKRSQGWKQKAQQYADALKKTQEELRRQRNQNGGLMELLQSSNGRTKEMSALHLADIQMNQSLKRAIEGLSEEMARMKESLFENISTLERELEKIELRHSRGKDIEVEGRIDAAMGMGMPSCPIPRRQVPVPCPQ